MSAEWYQNCSDQKVASTYTRKPVSTTVPPGSPAYTDGSPLKPPRDDLYHRQPCAPVHKSMPQRTSADLGAGESIRNANLQRR